MRLTQTDLAAHLRISVRQVQRLTDVGLPFIPTGVRGKIDDVVSLRPVDLPADLHGTHAQGHLFGLHFLSENHRPHGGGASKVVERVSVICVAIPVHQALCFEED